MPENIAGNSSNKIYVAVTAEFGEDGSVRPTAVRWEDGRLFSIDRIIDVRRAASLKAGGAGIRYTIQVGSRITHLFQEESRWFVERKAP